MKKLIARTILALSGWTVIKEVPKEVREKCVIICDRGVMDGSAYTDTNTW